MNQEHFRRRLERLAPRMPEISIRFGRQTGTLEIQADPAQFADPEEFRAWCQNMQHHIFSRIVMRPDEKLDEHAAAVRVQRVLTTLVRHQTARGQLKFLEGGWRYAE